MHRILIWFFIVSIFSACTQRTNYIIPEDKFLEILIDLHLYDALVQSRKLKDTELNQIDSAYLYPSLFAKHNVTSEQFDSSLSYYTSHPEILNEISNKAHSHIENLAEIEKKLSARLSTPENRIWNDNSQYFISGNEPNQKKIFHIPIDTTGNYFIKTSIRLQDNDESLNPFLKAYFVKDTLNVGEKIEFPIIPLIRSKFPHEYVLMQELNDTNYKFITLSLVNSENSKENYQRNMQITKIEVGTLNYQLNQ